MLELAANPPLELFSALSADAKHTRRAQQVEQEAAGDSILLSR